VPIWMALGVINPPQPELESQSVSVSNIKTKSMKKIGTIEITKDTWLKSEPKPSTDPSILKVAIKDDTILDLYERRPDELGHYHLVVAPPGQMPYKVFIYNLHAGIILDDEEEEEELSKNNKMPIIATMIPIEAPPPDPAADVDPIIFLKVFFLN